MLLYLLSNINQLVVSVWLQSNPFLAPEDVPAFYFDKEKGKSMIPQTPLFSIILTSHLGSLAYGSSTTTITATPSHALSGLSGSTSVTAADDTLTAELEAVMSLSAPSGVTSPSQPIFGLSTSTSAIDATATDNPLATEQFTPSKKHSK